ncbi:MULTISPECIES: hypothetical protein [unclassified Oleiphilus]|jgi:hypothetical protein|uniref:hypothetical protein n=3 Tax=Oleiphilus TaxID=141450 RepID=UPI000A8D5E1C|nr:MULTISPECIES: hypothetical protein [unclassified Oleiphilus]
MSRKSTDKKTDAVSKGTAKTPQLDQVHASEKKEKAKKNTSLRLDKKTLKALKIIAIEQETSIQKLIESLVKDYIKEHGKLD